MPYVAIEFHNNRNNTDVKGYLHIPDNFPPNWDLGFKLYLKENYADDGDVKIYPLNIPHNPRVITEPPRSFKNMANEFIKSLRSYDYYRPNQESDYIRRLWSLNEPANQDFNPRKYTLFDPNFKSN